MTDDIPASLEAIPVKPKSPVEAFVEIVERRGITIKDVRGDDRSPWNAKVRSIVAREMREAGYTLQQIGKAMHRDHTTVMYYLGRRRA